MSFTQNIAKHILPDRLYESLRGESQAWLMQCPCGAETSIWEMGGIRWKAAGQPQRMGRCGTCRRAFWGPVYLRSAVNGRGETMTPAGKTPIGLERTAALLLWIDGVGCWIAFPGPRVTIGGPVEPGSSQAAADLCVLANLRRLHATIERSGESYRLTSIAHEEPEALRDGSQIDLGGSLAMEMRIPSVLSQTAVLTPTDESWPRMFTAGRTPSSVDGIVLLDEVCLLGPGADAHVRCGDWSQTVIVYRRKGQLWCRSQGEIDVDGKAAADGAALSDASLVSGEGWRFRVEVVPRKVT